MPIQLLVFSGKREKGTLLSNMTKEKKRPSDWLCGERDAEWKIVSHSNTIAFRFEGNTMDQNQDISIAIQGLQQNHECQLVEDSSTGDSLWVEPYQIGETPSSYTASGVFTVVAFPKNNPSHILDTRRIYVLPKEIEIKDYKQMVEDLLSVHEWMRAGRSKAGLGFNTRDYLIGNLIPQLIDAIRFVRSRPSIFQEKTYMRVAANKIRRFDSQVMKSYVKRGGVGLVDAPVYQEDFNFYENQVIKSALLEIRRLLADAQQLLGDTDEEPKRYDYIDDKPEPIERSDRDAEERNGRRQCITRALTAVDKELSHPWYSSISDIGVFATPKPTPIFTRDTGYSTVYQLLLTILDDVRFKYREEAFEIGTHRAWKVFEWWCFLKCIEHLYKIGFEKADSNDSANADQEEARLREELTRCFSLTGGSEKEYHHPKLTKTLYVYNAQTGKMDEWGSVEVECSYQMNFRSNKSYRTPDNTFMFSFIKKGQGTQGEQSKWQYCVFADAKYLDERDASEQVKKTAIAKYLSDKDLQLEKPETDEQIAEKKLGSFIFYPTHPKLADEITKSISEHIYGGSEKHHYKSYKGESYRPFKCGMIPLAPSNLEGLEAFFKLLFQYYSYYYDTDHPQFSNCWACREVGEIDRDGKHKRFTCKCGATWAYSECTTCRPKPEPKKSDDVGDTWHSIVNTTGSHFGRRPKTTVKVGGKEVPSWFMQCPICGAQYSPDDAKHNAKNKSS